MNDEELCIAVIPQHLGKVLLSTEGKGESEKCKGKKKSEFHGRRIYIKLIKKYNKIKSMGHGAWGMEQREQG
jgi:hypothetical protein